MEETFGFITGASLTLCLITDDKYIKILSALIFVFSILLKLFKI